jgi:hypothetical protein
MNFQIPEGANVQIIIGGAAPLALTDQRAQPPEETTRKRGRSVLFTVVKLAGVAVFVIGGFWLGEQRVQAASEDGGFAAPPAVQQAFPTGPLAPSPPVTPGNAPQTLPSGFQAQLQQAPSIQPPPGQVSGSPAGAAGQNAFGLSQ